MTLRSKILLGIAGIAGIGLAVHLVRRSSRQLGLIERIPGGRAAGMKPSDFPRHLLEEGTRVEMEHTRSRTIAREIAMDHLAEDLAYYRKLKRIHRD